MARVSIKVKKYGTTITVEIERTREVRRGDYVGLHTDRSIESFDAAFMDDEQTIDALRWLCIMAGLPLENESIRRILRESGVLP